MWQMAVEMTVSILSSRGGRERRIQQRRDSKERDTTLTEFKEIHFILTSQSHTHKTLIAVENELISKMFSLIRHCTFERGNYFDTVKQARIISITATSVIF